MSYRSSKVRHRLDHSKKFKGVQNPVVERRSERGSQGSCSSDGPRRPPPRPRAPTRSEVKRAQAREKKYTQTREIYRERLKIERGDRRALEARSTQNTRRHAGAREQSEGAGFSFCPSTEDLENRRKTRRFFSPNHWRGLLRREKPPEFFTRALFSFF